VKHGRRITDVLQRAARLILVGVVTTAATACADERPFDVTALAQFKEPWAMRFLPDGRLLVTE
jgi:hypothetical protein